jgi:hypothetical protein
MWWKKMGQKKFILVFDEETSRKQQFGKWHMRLNTILKWLLEK